MQFPAREITPDLPVLGSIAGSCFKKGNCMVGVGGEDKMCHETHASQWDTALTAHIKQFYAAWLISNPAPQGQRLFEVLHGYNEPFNPI